MIKPKALQRGDTVCIVSLSSGLGGEEAILHRYEQGKKRLEEVFGLRVKTAKHALRGIRFLYENPAVRAADLMAAFQDPDVRGVVSMIGGEDTVRLLPHINFDVLRENPKVFLGFSDTTANHLMMYRAGLTSFYGPAILEGFAENGAMHDYTKHYVQKVLFEGAAPLNIAPSPAWTNEYWPWENADHDNIPRKMQPDARGYELLQGHGRASGPLLGGCLEVLPMVMATDIWPKPEQWEGSILFLETSEEHPRPELLKYILRGMAAQGILARINGIVVGKPKDEAFYEEYKEVYTRILGTECGRPNLPILYNLNFGHACPVCVLPYGAKAEIDCNAKSFRLLEAGVES